MNRVDMRATVARPQEQQRPQALLRLNHGDSVTGRPATPVGRPASEAQLITPTQTASRAQQASNRTGA
jgi:hypothetical protein